MEDIFKFLLVIGVIVVGLVKQVKKEAKKQADSKPASPIPHTGNPIPESWNDETYGGYIPKGPSDETIAPPASTKKPKPSKSKPFIPLNMADNSDQRFHTSLKQTISAPEAIAEEVNEPSEFEIHSIEEARRAIIWSEILQRKY